ncbi:hypothetical protein NHX12_017939 [Muraenolepis orangiensis]|uniref:Retrotransposon gag domain-containing protein n=1 Tax=Muraenolepis orangiensis TaxID=630683 RepID=A0A9Q0IXK7_9TELE|nr:hypothetical protein NHX12_017939 [Muraenolepis orangiensis]
MWDTDSPCCALFKEFSDEMRRVFNRSLCGREAARELLRIRQGTRTTYDYAINFRMLAASCDWDQQALFDAFFSGLCELVKDELVSHYLPNNLDSLIDVAGRTDAHLWSRSNNSFGFTTVQSS